MKKRFVCSILSFSVFILFSSCYWWVPDNNLDDIRGKTECKDFSLLNDPIILDFGVFQQFYLNGNQNMGQAVHQTGGSFVVYDWEKDKVFDYFFVPDSSIDTYSSDFLTVVKNKTGGYTALAGNVGGSFITTINSKGKAQRNKLVNNRIFDSKLIGAGGVEDSAFYCYTEIIVNDDNSTNVFSPVYVFYDGNSQDFTQPVAMPKYSGYGIDYNGVIDSEGNRWISYVTEDENDNDRLYRWFAKIDKSKKQLESVVSFDMYDGFDYDEYEGWSGSFEYGLLGCVGNKLVYTKESGESSNSDYEIFAYNYENKTTEKLEWTGVELNYKDVIVACNGKYYLICQSSPLSDGMKKFSIYRVESDLTVSLVPDSLKVLHDYTEFTVRGNKLYFASTEFSEEYNEIKLLFSFDTDSEKAGKGILLDKTGKVLDWE